MTSKELDEQLIQMKNDIWADVERLSELRSKYNYLDEKDAPYCRALDNAIQSLRDKADRIRIRYE